MDLLHSSDLLKIGFHTLARDYEHKKLSRNILEGIFGWVQLYLILAESGEDLLKIINVVERDMILDQNIIHIYLHISTNMIFNDLIEELLIGSTYIFQAKRHNPMIKKISVSNKSYFLFILRYHLNVIITGKGIYKSKELMAHGYIHQLVNSRK